MTISVIVMGFVALFISGPVSGFTDQARRARLVDAADAALERMTRELRGALPNSVRIAGSGATVAIEFLSTADGARYRAAPPGGDAALLDFAAADDSFNVIGPFTLVSKPFTSTSHYLVIYNVGVPGADAYELANVITPAGTQIDIASDVTAGEDRVTLSPAFRFAYTSPSRRVYLVSGAVSYLCDPVSGTLTRYSGYSLATDQSTRDSAAELAGAGGAAALMSSYIASCSFAYTPGTAERAGLVSLELAVSEQGESIPLLAQVHVDNVP
jgi:MSHA biogenesis protein MshO